MRLSYQNPASFSVLVDENGGVSDLLATPKSQNHTTKTSSEHTGRWSKDHAEALRARHRGKRSSSPDRRPKYDQKPLYLHDGEGGHGRLVHGDDINSLDGSISSSSSNNNEPNARITNNALPRQMYEAVMMMSSLKQSRQKRLSQPTISQRKHRKRQTVDDNMIVYRNDHPDGHGGNADEAIVNVVPLDSEHGGRIRVNLTIGSDTSIGGPVYALSLSLPGSAAEQDNPVSDFIQSPPSSPLSSSSAGTECECSCPCLEQDDEDPTTIATTSNAFITSTYPSSSSTTIDDDDTMMSSSTTFWTKSSSSTSERPELVNVTCPPSVVMFCEMPGK